MIISVTHRVVHVADRPIVDFQRAGDCQKRQSEEDEAFESHRRHNGFEHSLAGDKCVRGGCKTDLKCVATRKAGSIDQGIDDIDTAHSG